MQEKESEGLRDRITPKQEGDGREEKSIEPYGRLWKELMDSPGKKNGKPWQPWQRFVRNSQT